MTIIMLYEYIPMITKMVLDLDMNHSHIDFFRFWVCVASACCRETMPANMTGCLILKSSVIGVVNAMTSGCGTKN